MSSILTLQDGVRASGPPKLDLLRMTACQLQGMMQNKELTCVELVKQTLSQIESHNEAGAGLRAMISVAPKSLLLERAADLDDERRKGNSRGPLHGIPVIVKVSIRIRSCAVNQTDIAARTLSTPTIEPACERR